MLFEISQNLGSILQYHKYPPASNRDAWDNLPLELKGMLIEAGVRYLEQPYPMVLATDFMEFSRTGNRVHYENKFFARRTHLNALVLAECVEYQGRFRDAIINGVCLICEEIAWQLPAHNSYVRDSEQEILPDITRPVIDLFAAETGAVLAVTEYLLRDEFKKISPFISKMINEQIKKRIILPYLTEHFWWMGDGKSPMNNWTSWCTQNILLTVFTRKESCYPEWKEISEKVLHKACKSLDFFLADYEEDGCCDEGAQYYRHAALTLFISLEVLNDITDDGFAEVYHKTKIINMADYIHRAHIAGPYYINFADCSSLAGRCGVREFLFGKRTGNHPLMAFSAKDYQTNDNPLDLSEQNLFYRLQAIFHHQEIMDYKEIAVETDTAKDDIYYPSTGLFIARDAHFCLAVKGGNNGDSHNHNDTGSFIIYKDGQPLFIDIGVESYTKKTFSASRYEIWTMQSAWHNLPTFGNIMQKDGKEYGARKTEWKMDEHEACISMDLASAYPDHRILSYVRSVKLEKERRIMIHDHFKLDTDEKEQPAVQPVVLSLLTWEKPDIHKAAQDDNLYELKIGNIGQCRIDGVCHFTVEEVPIHDPRLKNVWKDYIYRVLLTVREDTVQLEIT